MKIRTLLSNQLYFGLDPWTLRRGAERMLSRVAGTPLENVRVTAQTLREDFRLDASAGAALLQELTTGGLFQSEGGSAGEYRLTERFQEFAQARVVAPLARGDAKQLVDQACRLAAKINADWTWNPLIIDMMAVSGDYMSRNDKIADLTLWPVVKARAEVRPRRLRAPMTKADGSAEIRAALRALNWFIVVHFVTATASVERPFSVPFRAYDDVIASPLATARLRDWSSSIRRQLTGS